MTPKCNKTLKAKTMDAETFARNLDNFKKEFFERKLQPFHKTEELSERSEVEGEDQLRKVN